MQFLSFSRILTCFEQDLNICLLALPSVTFLRAVRSVSNEGYVFCGVSPPAFADAGTTIKQCREVQFEDGASSATGESLASRKKAISSTPPKAKKSPRARSKTPPKTVKVAGSAQKVEHFATSRPSRAKEGGKAKTEKMSARIQARPAVALPLRTNLSSTGSVRSPRGHPGTRITWSSRIR